jgi:hypothetical protein
MKLGQDDDSAINHPAPEHDPEKWYRFSEKDHAQT